jgi:hypothetical protein
MDQFRYEDPVKIQYEFWILVLLDFIFGKLCSDYQLTCTRRSLWTPREYKI